MKTAFWTLSWLLLAACSSAPASPASFFDSTPSASAPNPVSEAPPTLAVATLQSTAAIVPVENFGELFFFLQPHQSGGDIRLARVAGLCVADQTRCPALQIVLVPFAFNFTISPLSWSPDGSVAAFAYSDQPAGTPTKLWRFDPTAGTWTALAQFAYIDPPFWSADSQWIAFRAQDGKGGEDIYIVYRDGSELKKVSGALPSSGRPYVLDGWLFDGLIVRSAPLKQKASTYFIRTGDSAISTLLDSLRSSTEFVPAPSGSLLAYDDLDYNTADHVLQVLRSDSTSAITLAHLSGGSIDPIVWSADSRKLAFNHFTMAAGGLPASQVFLVNSEGSNLEMVYQGVTVGHLVFAPHGGYLLIEETTSSTGGHLMVLDLNTLASQPLKAPGLSTDSDWYAPSWRP